MKVNGKMIILQEKVRLSTLMAIIMKVRGYLINFMAEVNTNLLQEPIMMDNGIKTNSMDMD